VERWYDIDLLGMMSQLGVGQESAESAAAGKTG
jgi:hypothetical protein